MRRLLVTIALVPVLAGACSSGHSSVDSPKTTRTTVSPLAAWLDSLTPPLRAFVSAQASYVGAQSSGDTAAIKREAQNVSAAARTLSLAMKASAPPADYASSVTRTETLLDQLSSSANGMTSCTDCRAAISQFTTTFTSTSNATGNLQTTAHPPISPAGTAGGSTSVTTKTPGTEAPGASPTTTAPGTSPGAAWFKSYGNDVINMSTALGSLAQSLYSSDPDVTAAACSAYMNAVNVAHNDPQPPTQAAVDAFGQVLNNSNQSYGTCVDDPALTSDAADGAIRNDLFNMGQAVQSLFRALSS